MSRRAARADAESPGRSDSQASIAPYRSRAVEQCRDLPARALERVAREGWRNIWQAHAGAESVRLPRPADAALFNRVHDLCRTPQAVANVMCRLEPGARIAIAGMKSFPWWAGPPNLLPWLKNRPKTCARPNSGNRGMSRRRTATSSSGRPRNGARVISGAAA